MRRLIESLTPGDHIYWRWVGGMFALYVVLMIAAAGVFVHHESSRKLAQEAAMTVAIDAKLRSIVQTSIQAPIAPHRVADNY
ncbi:hypothetical protein FFI89_004285 [Bradyrhizobium sp. KBS0727]|uniref:hypothetical protein n=1 Tax=unclassified Bradyrhizobium TaxID=2631580 RepID=UPI00110E784A|nr:MULTISPECIES: hypothetical protein [unclassified Bradyrhizobium]QDW36432.1 hypothetical protein FFI71_004285 [Bradyrhizobium sp. KBS0725]QDW43031.1 hypothetical protein FFI89_004285 [Bradyrhizobium sp. KBS0727]